MFPRKLAIALLILAPAVRAQDDCKPLRGVASSALDRATMSYLGPVHVQIGNEIFVGRYLPEERHAVTAPCDSLFCLETGVRLRIDFGNGDTMLLESKASLYEPSGLSWLFIGNVVGGTGRFANATGFFRETGKTLRWTDARDLQPRAQFRGEIGGSVCGLGLGAVR